VLQGGLVGSGVVLLAVWAAVAWPAELDRWWWWCAVSLLVLALRRVVVARSASSAVGAVGVAGLFLKVWRGWCG
jgi:hypothetical protein